MSRRWVIAAFLGLSSAALVPLPGRAASAVVKVSMKDFAFVPASVTINAGDVVEWTYDEVATDPMPNCESPYFQTPIAQAPHCPGHSSTSVAKNAAGQYLWDSGVKRADGFPFRVTFTTAGTFHYICTVHGGAAANNPLTHMEGDVIVRAAPAAAATTPPTSSSGNTQVAGAVSARALPATGTRSRFGAALMFLLVASMLGSRHGRRARTRVPAR